MSIMSQEAKKQLGCVLHWTGTLASANSPKQITSYGDVKQILPFSGAGIGMFDGTGDYLSVEDSTNIVSGNALTIECWCSLNSIASSYKILSKGPNNGEENVFFINGSGSQLIFRSVTSITIPVEAIASYTWVANTQYHIVYVRNGSSHALYVNGISLTLTTNIFGTIPTQSGNLFVGRNGNWTTYPLNGNLSELRISSVARYTANFTPPRRQLESDSNTKLLLHFNRNDTTFIDSSPSVHTITRYGDAKQLCSPCGSGVAYFDGTGDYLSFTASSDLSNPQMQFGAFVNFSSLPTSGNKMSLWSIRIDGDNTLNLSLYNNAGTQRIQFQRYSSGIAAIDIGSNWVSLSINTWYWISVKTDGINATLIVDSVDVNSQAFSGSLNVATSGTMWIGEYNAGQYFNGYMSDIFIRCGASAIEKPTQSLRPDSYTKLLLHMDGVGNAFYDSSDPPGDNGFPILPDGVTVTPTGTFAVEKMKDGRNIWKFDGSTNYVSLSDCTNWSIFEGDFTICGWINLADISASRAMCGQFYDSNNYWRFGIISSSNVISLYGVSGGVSTFVYSGSLTVSTNTWYHISVVKSGTTCLIYVNSSPVVITVTQAFRNVTDIAGVLTIGKVSDATFQNGNIKDLMIFKGKALTQDQIAVIYRETYIY